jgi:hypothetical protein
MWIKPETPVQERFTVVLAVDAFPEIVERCEVSTAQKNFTSLLLGLVLDYFANSIETIT